jgi:RHS repeat-associated protein
VHAYAYDAITYKFTGKERDTETGLDYFGARYYGSNMGRWMSPDWAAKPTAVPYAMFGDPQSLNLYGYVRNNPLAKADLDGHGDAMTRYYSCAECRAAEDADLAAHPVAHTLRPVVGLAAWFGGALTAPAAISPLLARFAPLLTTGGAALLKARDQVSTAAGGPRTIKPIRAPGSILPLDLTWVYHQRRHPDEFNFTVPHQL